MPTTTNKKRIAITPGEPAGIGPDITIMLAQQTHACDLIAIADPNLLKQRARQLNLPLDIIEYHPKQPSQISLPGQLKVLPIDLLTNVQAGKLNAKNSRYVLKTITRAVHACLDNSFDAMVTCPVHKGIINNAQFPFSGHTEYIADLTNSQTVMMLATAKLRVALVTTHIPVYKISASITHQRLLTAIKILHQELIQYFGIKKPKILVCGLNPHAGEDGHLGHEEIEIIQPVLNNLRQSGFNLQGPLPADTIFTPKYLASADAVLAMYHDQGLPVLKHIGFGQAVNITLGLPIIRTSVDHGTALDLASTGKATIGSLQNAIASAQSMINFKQQQNET